MASKLIVNEIEHTDGSGTAVTMAKATITDLTSGTIGSGVTGGSGLTALGTVTAGNLSNTAIVYPAGHIIKKSAFHNNDLVTISANNVGGELFTQTFTAKALNSAYYFSCTIASANTAITNSDAGDRGYIAWLSDASANKYYFGYRRTGGRYAAAGLANSDYYYLCEGDGGYFMNSAWNQSFYTFTDIPGNQPSYNNTTVVNSVFTAGETLTLHIWGVSYNGFYYNQANNAGSASSNAYSHYCITEIAG